MWLMLCIFVFIVLLQAVTPFLTRKTAVFGVFIPEPYTNHQKLLTYKKSYSFLMLVSGVVLIAIQQLFFKEQAVYGLLCLMFVLLLLATLGYLLYRQKVFQLKQTEQWTIKTETKHVTDLALREQFFVLPAIFFILPMLVTLALIAYTYMHYASIPMQVPIHWNYKGEADDWVTKSVFTVLLVPLLLFVLQLVFLVMNNSLSKAVIRLSVQQTAQSAQREMKHRKGSSFYFAISSYSVTILMVTLHYSSLILQQSSVSFFNWLFVGFFVALIGSVVYIAFLQLKMNEPFESLATNETLPDDDRYWKLGVFYFNPQDPSFLIPKRFGVGWTVNFANKWAYMVLLIVLVPLLLLWRAE